MGALHRLLAGAVAGAAGTAALDASTYLDMAVRGRPASTTPEQTMAAMTTSLHVPVPGDDQRRRHRLQGLGGLAGILTGTAVGAAYALAVPRAVEARPALAVPLLTAGVMTATNGSMLAYGVTDPREWSAVDWASDVVPHAVYAAVVHGVLRMVTDHRA